MRPRAAAHEQIAAKQGALATGADPTTADTRKPLVHVGSFQVLLGRNKSGNIKARNTWLHETNWDLVVFDEYHSSAWRDSAKELFEGEEESEAKKEAAADYHPALDGFNEELDELGENETEFLSPRPVRSESLEDLRRLPTRRPGRSTNRGAVRARGRV